jgi:hypothetical protein
MKRPGWSVVQKRRISRRDTSSSTDTVQGLNLCSIEVDGAGTIFCMAAVSEGMRRNCRCSNVNDISTRPMAVGAIP